MATAGQKDEPAKAKKPLGARGQPRPTYNPLPIVVHQLPPLIPHNPLSLLHVAYVCLKQLLFPPLSFPESPYIGVFSVETCSVHVTDESSVIALWRNGFFGKGNLSRSEPTWLDREKRRRGIAAGETAEELTTRRRAERKAFKQERARKEREEIDAQRLIGIAERGNGDLKEQSLKDDGNEDSDPLLPPAAPVERGTFQTVDSLAAASAGVTPNNITSTDQNEVVTDQLDLEVFNQEHLQLELTEAFFLSYALGVLRVYAPSTGEDMSIVELFMACLAHSTFPPQSIELEAGPPAPDNPFLISYVAYHHFRSLGWVVRSGVKFGVDLLLYNRGPVFSHAEFAIHLIPSYSHPYWKSEEGLLLLGKKRASRPWHWLHMINRVQSQVRKTLVACFVEVPPPFESNLFQDLDITKIIKRYKIREMAIRRWVPNRSRD